MARAQLILADLVLSQGTYAEAGRLGRQVLDLNVDDPFLNATAHLPIAIAARVRGDLGEAHEHLEFSRQIAVEHSLLEVQLYVALVQSNMAADQGDNQGAFTAARSMVALAQQVGNSFMEQAFLPHPAMASTVATGERGRRPASAPMAHRTRWRWRWYG